MNITPEMIINSNTKEVYCKDCKWVYKRIVSPGIVYIFTPICHNPVLSKEKIKCDGYEKLIIREEIPCNIYNKNNNCKYYKRKRKWWKFWEK